MSLTVEKVTRDDLTALVDERRYEVRAFVDWAASEETDGTSMYLANRPDISDARQAAALFPEAWWGVVVFTCFGSLNSARAVRDVLEEPVDADAAEELLASIRFTRPKVGHHRIQQGLVGRGRHSSLPVTAATSFTRCCTRRAASMVATNACSAAAWRGGGG